jgi:hypothetical protein
MSKTNTGQPTKARNSSDSQDAHKNEGANSKLYTPTAQERALVEKFYEDQKRETPSPIMRAQKEESGNISLRSDHKDSTVAYALLAKALGTTEVEFISGMLSQLGSATTGKGQEVNEDGLNFVLSVLAGVAPRDRVEAMLAAQMAVVHLATMTFTRRLAHIETTQQQDSAQNALNKLMRTFTSQVETLKRYRSTAQQTVKVEHVHVHEGGQAIVGNVQTPGGAVSKRKDQTHAQIAHAPEPEMRGTLAEEREAVPQRSDEKR